MLSYNLTWCDEAGDCDTERVRHSEATVFNRHNISGLKPWTQYTVTVTAVNMDPARRALPSPPLIQRTAASAPASKPLDLILKSVTNVTAEVSWSKPLLGNGPVSHYKVLISNWYMLFINTFHLTGFSSSRFLRFLPYETFHCQFLGSLAPSPDSLHRLSGQSCRM